MTRVTRAVPAVAAGGRRCWRSPPRGLAVGARRPATPPRARGGRRAAAAPETRLPDAVPVRAGVDRHAPATATARAASSIDWNRPDDADDPVVASAPGVVVRGRARPARRLRPLGACSSTPTASGPSTPTSSDVDGRARPGRRPGRAARHRRHDRQLVRRRTCTSRSGSGSSRAGAVLRRRGVHVRLHPGLAELRRRPARRQLPRRPRGRAGGLPARQRGRRSWSSDRGWRPR